MKKLMFVISMLLSASALAESMTVQWQLPTNNCFGSDVQAGDIGDIEIYYSDQPIPGPTTVAEACSSASNPPPASLTPVVVPASDQTVTINLAGGKDYHIRARVFHTPTGMWSGLSPEVVKNVPFGPLLPPVIVKLNPRDGSSGS